MRIRCADPTVANVTRGTHSSFTRNVTARDFLYLFTCLPADSVPGGRANRTRSGGRGGGMGCFSRTTKMDGRGKNFPTGVTWSEAGRGAGNDVDARVYFWRTETDPRRRTDGDGPELASGVRPSRRHRLQWAVLRLPGALGGTATRATARRAARNRVTA